MAYSNSETGRRMRLLRTKKNITMEELADQTGYDSKSRKTIIYQIETGHNEIRLSRLLSFSSALKTNIYYLLGLTDISDLSDEDVVRLIREHYGTKERDEVSDKS